MTERVFRLRLHCRYRQPDNLPDQLTVERHANGQWQPFEFGFKTPGFESFVYTILNCQHLYMRVNAAERGLALAAADGTIEVVADDDWRIQRLRVGFAGRLQAGTPADADIAYIVERMRHCPVSVNLREIPDALTTLTLA